MPVVQFGPAGVTSGVNEFSLGLVVESVSWSNVLTSCSYPHGEEAAMALVINGKCICCDVCLPECPNDAISAGEEIFVIDQKKCTQCVGFYDYPQCIEVCPTEAVDEVPA